LITLRCHDHSANDPPAKPATRNHPDAPCAAARPPRLPSTSPPAEHPPKDPCIRPTTAPNRHDRRIGKPSSRSTRTDDRKQMTEAR
jgi:hypothetical protein